MVFQDGLAPRAAYSESNQQKRLRLWETICERICVSILPYRFRVLEQEEQLILGESCLSLLREWEIVTQTETGAEHVVAG